MVNLESEDCILRKELLNYTKGYHNSVRNVANSSSRDSKRLSCGSTFSSTFSTPTHSHHNSISSSMSSSSEDPNGQKLRKFLHRDIFTTFINDPQKPENYTIRESYLLKRDDTKSKFQTHQPKVLSISELSTNNDNKLEHHELGYALRRIGGPRPGSAADTESTFSSDEAGSYSPPTSVSSWSPKESANEEEFTARRHSKENLPRIIKNAPKYEGFQGEHVKTGSYSSDFDFLRSGISPGSPGSPPSRSVIVPITRSVTESQIISPPPDEVVAAAFMERLHQTQPKKKPSFEYRQYHGYNSRKYTDDSHSTSSEGEKNGVDAGIPPKVPPHRIFSSPVKAIAANLKSESEKNADQKNIDGNNDIYTRKCSQVQRRSTIMKNKIKENTSNNNDKILNVPKQREIKKSVETSQYREVSNSSTLSVPSSTKFALPGYEDNTTTLKVVNGSRTGSSTTINSVPGNNSKLSLVEQPTLTTVPLSTENSYHPIRRIRFQEPEVKEFDDFASSSGIGESDSEDERIHITSSRHEISRRRNFSTNSIATSPSVRLRRTTSIYEATEMADPYQQYFFGVEIADSSIMDDIWAKRGEGFFETMNKVK